MAFKKLLALTFAFLFIFSTSALEAETFKVAVGDPEDY